MKTCFRMFFKQRLFIGNLCQLICSMLLVLMGLSEEIDNFNVHSKNKMTKIVEKNKYILDTPHKLITSEESLKYVDDVLVKSTINYELFNGSQGFADIHSLRKRNVRRGDISIEHYDIPESYDILTSTQAQTRPAKEKCGTRNYKNSNVTVYQIAYENSTISPLIDFLVRLTIALKQD